MTKKRWSDEPQLITEFEGFEQTVYARTDQYETEAEFMVAAQKCADDHDDGLLVSNPRQTMLRINPCDKDTQESLGTLFVVLELGLNARPGPGRWRSWAANVSVKVMLS